MLRSIRRKVRTVLMLLSILLAITFVMSVIPTLSARAANDSWERLPIYGGTVYCSLEDGQTLYAGTEGGGVFKTTDNGVTWQNVSGILSGSGFSSGAGNIYELCLFNNAIYAATATGIFVTSDGGGSWAKVFEDSLASATMCVYGGNLYIGSHASLLISSDGASWTEEQITGYDSINALVTDGTALYAGCGPGAYVLNDGTGVWDVVGNNSPTNVTSIAFHGGELYLVGGFPTSNVYKYDGSTAWTAISGGTIADGLLEAFLYSDGTTLWVASTTGVVAFDGTSTWTAMNNGLRSTNINTIITFGGELFAGTMYSGVYKSSDNGANWSTFNNGIMAQTVQGLIYHDGVLYAGTLFNGVQKSTDDGLTWVDASTGLSGNALNVTVLCIHNGVVFVGTDDGVYKTTDGGVTWLPTGLLGFKTTSLVSSGGALLASSMYETTFYLSTDNGNGWNTNSFVSKPANAGSANGELFVCTSDGNIYKSSDHGSSWTSLNMPLPYNGYDGLLCASWFEGVDFYACFNAKTGSNLWSSHDGGASWNDRGMVLHSTGIDPRVLHSVNGVLYVGSTFGEIYRSIDDGSTWENAGFSGGMVNALVSNSDWTFAGTEGGSVYRKVVDAPVIQTPTTEDNTIDKQSQTPGDSSMPLLWGSIGIGGLMVFAILIMAKNNVQRKKETNK